MRETNVDTSLRLTLILSQYRTINHAMQVHDFVTNGEEFLRSKRFREEVRKVLIRLYVQNHELTVLDHLADVKVSPVDMFTV